MNQLSTLHPIPRLLEAWLLSPSEAAQPRAFHARHRSRNVPLLSKLCPPQRISAVLFDKINSINQNNTYFKSHNLNLWVHEYNIVHASFKLKLNLNFMVCQRLIPSSSSCVSSLRRMLNILFNLRMFSGSTIISSISTMFAILLVVRNCTDKFDRNLQFKRIRVLV